jgi:hypothetical protein
MLAALSRSYIASAGRLGAARRSARKILAPYCRERGSRHEIHRTPV